MAAIARLRHFSWQQKALEQIAVIGECLVEISDRNSSGLAYAYGGDTLNTALYLARELGTGGPRVDYVTAVGDDPFSRAMVNYWIGEGLGVDQVAVLPGEQVGLYWIVTDSQGEKKFYYWRGESAAKKLMSAPRAVSLWQSLNHPNIIYLSGITLAILPAKDREQLLELLRRLGSSSSLIVFDSNYRPSLWESPQEAQFWMRQLADCAHLATPSFEDERNLYGDASPADTVRRLQSRGVAEIVVKNSVQPCTLFADGQLVEIPLASVVRQQDTTAAGDSFNAAYISSRIKGSDGIEAVLRAQQLASKVVQYPGAIIPKNGLV